MRCSDAGRAFIKAFESLRLTPYRDDAGNWTVGYGHLIGSDEPIVTWTQDHADAEFAADVTEVDIGLADLISVELRQHEFDAIASFAFNCGTNAFRNSTLRRVLNEQDYVAAALELGRWGRAGGKWNAGLLRRRIGEMAIFLLADYSRVP